MTRSDRVERLLKAMDRELDKRIAKLRGSGRAEIEQRIRAEAAQNRTIFLVALACVSDADLGTLEEEMGLARGDRHRALGAGRDSTRVGDSGGDSSRQKNSDEGSAIPPKRRATRRPPPGT
jgi:hypothetical protein